MRTLKTFLFLALGFLYIAAASGCSAANPVAGPEVLPGGDITSRNAATSTTADGWQPTNEGAVGTMGPRLMAKAPPPNRDADPECGSETDMDGSHSNYPGNKPKVTIGFGQNSSGPWERLEYSDTTTCGDIHVPLAVPLQDEKGLNVLDAKRNIQWVWYPFIEVDVVYCEKRGSCFKTVPSVVIDGGKLDSLPKPYLIPLQAVQLDYYPYDTEMLMMPPPKGILPEDPQPQQMMMDPNRLGNVLP